MNEVIGGRLNLESGELTLKLHVTPKGLMKKPPVIVTLSKALEEEWSLVSAAHTDKGVIVWLQREWAEVREARLVSEDFDGSDPWPTD